MTNNETLADILAEMRERAARRELPPEVYGLADRFEAAAKRERAERHDYELAECECCDRADAAAMREALEEQLRYWNTHVRTRDEEAMRVRTAAALVAPPRNCDRFSTLAAATDAWRMENRTWQWGDGDTAVNYMTARASQDVGEFLVWLFAPAKGGQ